VDIRFICRILLQQGPAYIVLWFTKNIRSDLVRNLGDKNYVLLLKKVDLFNYVYVVVLSVMLINRGVVIFLYSVYNQYPGDLVYVFDEEI
jgi:hypothetical protein